MYLSLPTVDSSDRARKRKKGYRGNDFNLHPVRYGYAPVLQPS